MEKAGSRTNVQLRVGGWVAAKKVWGISPIKCKFDVLENNYIVCHFGGNYIFRLTLDRVQWDWVTELISLSFIGMQQICSLWVESDAEKIMGKSLCLFIAPFSCVLWHCNSGNGVPTRSSPMVRLSLQTPVSSICRRYVDNDKSWDTKAGYSHECTVNRYCNRSN